MTALEKSLEELKKLIADGFEVKLQIFCPAQPSLGYIVEGRKYFNDDPNV